MNEAIVLLIFDQLSERLGNSNNAWHPTPIGTRRMAGSRGEWNHDGSIADREEWGYYP